MTAPELRPSKIFVENPQVTLVRNLKRILKKRREETGHGLRHFAAASGISVSTLRCYVYGYRWPRPEHLQRLCSELGVPVEVLFRR